MLASDGFAAEAPAMNDPPASTAMPPLRIIGHRPPIVRRAAPTTSCTSPETIAQAPHTRRTAGFLDVQATATPTAASRLIAMFSCSPRAGPVAPDERVSTTAAAASNRGYRTTRAMLTGPRSDLVANSRRAQTTANPNRTKYNRRRAGAIPGAVDEATVVTTILSNNQRTGPGGSADAAGLLEQVCEPLARDRTFYRGQHWHDAGGAAGPGGRARGRGGRPGGPGRRS